MNAPPALSVIIPAFNGMALIEAAIVSVLAQGEVSSEILIIDDGSQDETASCVERMARNDDRIRLFREMHGGVAAARNRGLARARAPFVTFLDQDDIKPAGGLTRHVEILTGNPNLGAVVGESVMFDQISERGDVTLGRHQRMLATLLGAGTFRRDLFADLGDFACDLEMGSDYDFYLRMIEADIPIAVDEEVALLHRRHSGNASSDRRTLSRELLLVFHRSVQRRRRNGYSAALRHPLLDAMRAQWPGG
ncbi:glycosyltransferase family A protein [Kaistia defluvii]|uniref:glycosyltransferase family 2 protein n=1 Tax=Kaistia defluvii TaxID=410841 RepID=UPI0022546703|nr:glycosyltransferase family A protein [Kaistia defluvii]MCX5518801.1 glycosyltransferase family A protein [Kaistia defluvii]